MNPQHPDVLFIRTEGRFVRLDLKELSIVEGLKDYLRFWTNSGKIIVHGTMKSVEQELERYHSFIRISRSYIVNLAHVAEVDGSCVIIQEERLPIGVTYKERFMEVINHLRFI